MKPSHTLEAALAAYKAEAAVLRANGHAAQAQSIERFHDDICQAAGDWLSWQSEPEAQLRSGKGTDFFRARRKEWQQDGLAEQRGRRWFYRRVVVPRRALPSIAAAEAHEVAS